MSDYLGHLKAGTKLLENLNHNDLNKTLFCI